MQAMPYISIASSLIGFMTDRKAAGDQEDIYKADQLRQQQESEESLRQEKLENESEESMNKAKAAASGIDSETGSSKAFTDEQKRQNRLKEEWIIKSGQSKGNLIGAKGKAAVSATKAKSYGKLFDAAGTAAGAGWFGN